jgi:hypothetical protein
VFPPHDKMPQMMKGSKYRPFSCTNIPCWLCNGWFYYIPHMFHIFFLCSLYVPYCVLTMGYLSCKAREYATHGRSWVPMHPWGHLVSCQELESTIGAMISNRVIYWTSQVLKFQTLKEPLQPKKNKPRNTQLSQTTLLSSTFMTTIKIQVFEYMFKQKKSIEQFAIESKEMELQRLKTTILQQSNCNHL